MHKVRMFLFQARALFTFQETREAPTFYSLETASQVRCRLEPAARALHCITGERIEGREKFLYWQPTEFKLENMRVQV